MISIAKRFLIIHVPKTGGNSIQNILRNYSEDDIVTPAEHQDGVERFEVRSRRYNTTKHSPLSHYKSVLDADIYGSLFKFATIRNPWDRMVSFYFSPHRGVVEWNRQEFLALFERVSTLRYYICERPFSENASSQLDPQGAVPNTKIESDIDFIIRFDYLDNYFKVVTDSLGIPHFPLAGRNSSVRAHYSKYYDDELKETVRAKFSEEIELGSYSFEDDWHQSGPRLSGKKMTASDRTTINECKFFYHTIL